MNWIVYMVETESGRLYTGITTDIERRFREHKEQNKGARFFRTDPAKRVVYTEQCRDRSEATKREIAIKKLSRAKKLALVGAE